MGYRLACRAAFLGSAAAALIWAAPAWSQAATTNPPGAVEPDPGSIIVTARKRAENVQSIPDAITAITSETISRAGIQTLQDVAQLTPNLVIIDQLRPGIQTVSLRGFTTVQGGKAPFATIIDGVQQPGMEYLAQSLVDLERIEVVRGPQGTLYGGGAIAGAINIVTKKPTNDFEGAVKAGYFNGPGWTATGTVSGPIIKDQLYFRASVYHVKDDGLIPNLTTGNAVDTRNDTAVRARLLYTPTDRLTVDVNGSYTRGKDGALWLVPVSNSDFENYSTLPSTDIDGRDNRRLYSVSGKIDFELDGATLTSISAYNKARQFLFADGDFSPAPLYAQTWRDDSRSYSEELRLASNNKASRLQYVVGFFYQNYQVIDITQFGSVVAPGNYNYFSTNPNRYKSSSYAFFGQASYDLTSKLQVTAGLRYDNDHQAADNPLDPTQPKDKNTFKRWQPKAQLSYKFTPDLLGYVSYATGFRTGGFNPNSPFALRIYNNEVSDNYEAGLKATFFGGRLTANAAAFHTLFDNQQFFFSRATDTGIYRVIINIPRTEVNGGELEVVARPNRMLMLRGSLGYNDTNIKRFDDAGSYRGNRTPQVYGLTLGGSAELTVPLGMARLIARTDVEHRGDVYWDIENTLRSTPKTFVNARVALQRGPFELAGYARNLTNERTPAAVGANALGPGRTLRSLNEPRRYGVEGTFKF